MTQDIADVLGETEEDFHVSDPFAGQVPASAASYTPFGFTAKRFVLSGLAEKAGAVAPSRDYQPVLKHFSVRVSSAGLRFVATDLQLMVQASSPSVVTDGIPEGSSRTVLLPARRLLTILREAPEGDVSVRVSGDKAVITAGTASWELKLTADEADFPSIPEISSLTLHETSRGPLLHALRTVRHAVSRAGSKPHLSQVDIRVGGGTGGEQMRVTASDGPRFAQIALPGFPEPMRISAAGTPSAVDELIRMLGASEAETVRAGRDGEKLTFAIDSVIFTSAMLQQDFPDMGKQLLEPALANKDELVVDRAELTAAVNRVRINADRSTSVIGLMVRPGEVTVYARDAAKNGAEQTIGATWSGPERTLVVNHQYLLDMLKVHQGSSCSFWLGKDTGKRKTSVLLRDAKFTGIISQMAGSLVGY